MLADVHGQEEAVTVLHRAVAGHLRYPLLLIGEEGVGRKFSSLAAIKEMVASDRGPTSSEVRQISLGVHPDVHVIAPEAGKDIGIEAVREAIEIAHAYPTAGPCRFFVLDGVDRITAAAANALLKTIEEPPAGARFFLLAESYGRVLPTIRSRCGRVTYRRLSESFLYGRMSAVEADPERALTLARLAEGSVGRALGYWSASRLTLRDHALSSLRYGLAGDFGSLFGLVDEIGSDLPLFFRFLRLVVHDLLVLPVVPDRLLNVDRASELASLPIPPRGWVGLWASLRAVESRLSGPIHFPFHLKSAFVDALALAYG